MASTSRERMVRMRARKAAAVDAVAVADADAAAAVESDEDLVFGMDRATNRRRLRTLWRIGMSDRYDTWVRILNLCACGANIPKELAYEATHTPVMHHGQQVGYTMMVDGSLEFTLASPCHCGCPYNGEDE